MKLKPRKVYVNRGTPDKHHRWASRRLKLWLYKDTICNAVAIVIGLLAIYLIATLLLLWDMPVGGNYLFG